MSARLRVPSWSRRGAVVALAGGLALVGVGIGLAGPHLAKVGFTLAALVGVVVFLIGAFLVVTGAARMIRHTRWFVRVPALGAVVVVAALVVPTVGVAVAATHVPPTAVGPMGSVGTELGLRESRFRTADGLVLAGWYAPGTNGAGVVVRHGAGSTRSSVVRHGAVLARHGYAVLLVDARGHGDSEGRAMDLGWFGDQDTAAAVAHLRTRAGVDPERIGVLGLSMGGEEAIGALGADERIAAVVAEGATGRAAADKAWLSEAFGWRGWVQEQIEGAQTALVDLLTAAEPPASLRSAVAAAAPRPVLLVAAGEVDDEIRAGRYIRSGSPGTVQLWVVPGAGHTDGLAVAPEEWERRVTAFLNDALLAEVPG